MSLEQLQQNYADATGFVIDRTANPPKIIGQAFLISRNRAVTCGSVVYNYAEAPWALAINFVHPDVLIGVRSMVIHPDFDKKAARTWYLGQTGMPGEQLVLMNDIATLSIDIGLTEMPQDKVGELNRALSLPFSGAGVEASGNIRGNEFLSVLSGLLQANKSGLLTLYDSRNLPLARIQIGPTGIQKVYFRGLLGELAFFELIYRHPAEGYSFQSQSDFNWANVRDITAPTDALVQEAQRRVEELPGMFKALGGPDARYQQRIENYDAEAASENIRWFAERLWNCIDGYLTLDKMSERAGVDTYTILQAIREMVNKAQVSMINRATPFHQNGALGNPLISHTDFEVNAWDPLQSFFLDPLSGGPTWMQGNFFGVANALQPKNMLHTIAMPHNVPGGLILKDYKLIGIHSGAHTPRPNQPQPPVKVYQMMWMGALLDMSAKKKGEEQGETGEQVPSAIAGLRTKAAETEGTAKVPVDKLEKFVCPNCYTTNTQVGPCFNCGTQITAPEPETTEGQKTTAAAETVKKLQEKSGLSKNQLLIGGGVVAALLIVAMSTMFAPQGQTPIVPIDSSSQHKSSEKAVKIAVESAGFKGTPIPGYWYEDTGEMTKPTPSFGLYSDQSNQKVNFLIFDDMGPVQDLKNFVGLPPYSDVLRADDVKEVKVDENYQVLGDGKLHWFVGRYFKSKPKAGEDINELVLVGAYPSPIKGKAVLVVGQAMDVSKNYDYKSTLWLCDQMAADYTARGNVNRVQSGELVSTDTATSTAAPDKSSERPVATDKQLDEFIKKVQETIISKYKTPDDVAEELKKKHPAPLKATLSVVISDEDGSVKKLEILHQADYFESLSNSLTKAVNDSAPFPDPPRTKEGSISMVVKIDKDKIHVERP